ncbi:MAG: MerR family transcriptional regulator [Dehalococcoidia bacterium]
MALDRKEPVYAIGVVARMVGVHQQTLRNYERWGLVIPCRSSGGFRLYSQEDLDRIQQIREWVDDLGINLAGVEVMTRLLGRIRELEGQVNTLTAEVVRLRDGSLRLPG